MIKIRWFIVGVHFLLALQAFAQHNSAVSDRYTPTNSVLLNPASIADPRPFVDFRLVGVSAQVENNLYLLPGGNITNAINADVEDGVKYNAAVNADIYLPAMVIAKGYRSFGFNIRQRNMVYGKNVTSDVAGFIKNGLNYPRQHNQVYNSDNFYVKYMSWAELGLNYAQIIKRDGDVIMTAGGSLKLLNGMGHLAMLVDNQTYEVDSLHVNIHSTQSKMGLSTPGASLGMGVGADLGFEFRKMLTDDNAFHTPHSVRSKCGIKEYKYKFGVSLIDLGFINFKRSTYHWAFENDSIFWNNYETNNIDGITKMNTVLTNSSANAGSTLENKNKFTALMPLALNAQFDYNLENNFFFYSSLELGLHQRLTMGTERVSRLSLIPRYERERITAALPVTISRHQKPGLGFYLRAYFFSIGTNNFVPLLLKNDTYGADVYVSLNWQILHSKPCQTYFKKRKDYCPKPTRNFFKKKKKKPRELNLEWK